jgi:hypothetical protein
MSIPRKLLVLVVSLFLTGASLHDTVLHRDDHWPISSYGMYAGAESPGDVALTTVSGITRDGRELTLGDDDFVPFDRSRLRLALDRVLRKPRPLQERALRNLLEIYERNRREGRHGGPEIAGLRASRVTWHVTPDEQRIVDREPLVDVRR